MAPLQWAYVSLSLVIFTFSARGILRLIKYLLKRSSSALRDLRGPKSTSFLFGNHRLVQVCGLEAAEQWEKWEDEYGSLVQLKYFLNTNRVAVLDLRAVSHIFSNNFVYEKPPVVRSILSSFMGPGLLFVEGEQHKQQRRIMNPAFGSTQIHQFVNLFLYKSQQLRDALLSETSASSSGHTKIDIVPWLNKLTLDIIGLAGFDYAFDSLNPKDGGINELHHSVRMMLAPPPSGFARLMTVGRYYIPALRLIPTKRDRIVAAAQNTMNRIGTKLIADSKASVLASGQEKEDDGSHAMFKKDLLSLLVRNNMEPELPGHVRMDDTEVLAQITTMIIAGHDTTSTGVTWALLGLSSNLASQARLRSELFSVQTPSPSMEELNSLPYLDAVVRETLRYYSPVPHTVRVANRDDVIPLSEPWVDKHGVVRKELRMIKGDTIVIPFIAIHFSKKIWGPDAHEFKPERWSNLPPEVQSIPGVWGNSLAFSAGPRACIGFRFSVMEMKAILFTLLRSFRFGLAVPLHEIKPLTKIVQKPYLTSDLKAGTQLPLNITPLEADGEFSES
ncbi:cytochrome P450 [Stereum hirsutum FP-91666 SS1]|uniref:cytochrome P450 n=1 Tax=Stereum hirsutum (strain FP-91666) TaxID=721885 RepID=UPI0004449EEC|nr:cytochrome P450 [Stereum hirsutum FP-91666 SS1]EIM81184.1 cytochrome P450 [Stereum hirsutum FP-91666 SS1]